MKKRILLVGGRSKAKSLSQSLLGRGFEVTVVNRTYEDCLALAENKALHVIHGDGTKPHILDEADASHCHIAIALSSVDEDNLLVCQLCKKQFGIRKTVALVSDPKKRDFFYKMGVDSVVCAISAVTSVIEQQTFVEDMANIVPIGNGRVHIAQVPISESSPVAGKKLWETNLPKEVIVGCILRGDTAIIPRGDSRLHVGDMLVVISGSGQEMEAIRMLTGGSL